MKQSLIALAVAGAFAAPAAMAAATIGGEIDVAYQQFNNGTNSGLQATDTHSRWWMDATDDIGGGMSVVGHFEIDQGVSNPRGMNNRNSFIGLKGDFGMVKIGAEEGIYEQLGYQVDPYHGAAGPAGNIVNGLGQAGAPAVGLNDLCGAANPGCNRLANTLSYVSPNISGLNFKVDFSNFGPAPTGGQKKSVIQAGAYWGGNVAEGVGLRVAAGMFSGKQLDAGVGDLIDKTNGTRVVVGGTVAGLSLDLLIEQNKWSDEGDVVKANHMWLTGSYALPTGSIAFNVAKLGKTKLNGTELQNTDGTHMGVGYYHTLSKASSAYVIYSALKNKDAAQFTLVDGATEAVGKDPSSISVGLYTVF